MAHVIMPEFREVAEDVAERFGVTLAQVRRPNRQKAMVKVREAIAHAVRIRGASWPEVGAVLARDHTSCMYLCGWITKKPPKPKKRKRKATSRASGGRS